MNYKMCRIDYNVTTKGSERCVSEVVYYNPYYKKERPNQIDFGPYYEDISDLQIILVESFS